MKQVLGAVLLATAISLSAVVALTPIAHAGSCTTTCTGGTYRQPQDVHHELLVSQSFALSDTAGRDAGTSQQLGASDPARNSPALRVAGPRCIVEPPCRGSSIRSS